MQLCTCTGRRHLYWEKNRYKLIVTSLEKYTSRKQGIVPCQLLAKTCNRTNCINEQKNRTVGLNNKPHLHIQGTF